MKIVQLSDLHGVQANHNIGEIDPLSRLDQAIEHINTYHSDAHFCAVTGDIADTGSPQAYRLVRQSLDSLKMSYHPIIGNHDSREEFLAEFTQTPIHDGFINYRLDLDKFAFLFLDTLKQDHHDGEFCRQRCEWLETQLETVDRDQRVILFMHHPPFSVTLPWMDRIMMKSTDAFYEVIRNKPIAYLFFGHIHRPAFGIWRNIPYASSRSVGHYQVSTHNRQGYDFPMNQEPPMYSVITLLDDQIHVDLADIQNDAVVFQS